jgi:hypothetical protein
MGGKKKAANKKGKGGDDDEFDPNKMNEILQAKVDALKSKIVLEQERRDQSMSNQESSREEGKEMSGKIDEAKESTRQVVTQMTKTYKNMEEGLTKDIEKAKEDVTA